MTSVAKSYCNTFLVIKNGFMITFLKDSFRELKHVVWPSWEDTRKYFFIVVGVLIAFWLYVFAASTLFTNIIFALKDLIK